jgi:hypothetical protein
VRVTADGLMRRCNVDLCVLFCCKNQIGIAE